KSSPNLTKFCRHDHRRLVNTSTEGIDELLHGLGEIDEIRSKIGVFSRTPKLRSVVTRDFWGFNTRLDGFESLQRLTKSSRSKPSSRVQESTAKIEFQSSKAQDERNRSEFKAPEGTRREGPPFPHDLCSKYSRIHASNPREERGG